MGMTIEQAISTLEPLPRLDDEYEALYIAEDAMEKQIPKKLFPDKYDIKRICPSCRTTIQTQRIYTDTWGGKVYKTILPKHCDNCGQAIDWNYSK